MTCDVKINNENITIRFNKVTDFCTPLFVFFGTATLHFLITLCYLPFSVKNTHSMNIRRQIFKSNYKNMECKNYFSFNKEKRKVWI